MLSLSKIIFSDQRNLRIHVLWLATHTNTRGKVKIGQQVCNRFPSLTERRLFVLEQNPLIVVSWSIFHPFLSTFADLDSDTDLYNQGPC